MAAAAAAAAVEGEKSMGVIREFTVWGVGSEKRPRTNGAKRKRIQKSPAPVFWWRAMVTKVTLQVKVDANPCMRLMFNSHLTRNVYHTSFESADVPALAIRTLKKDESSFIHTNTLTHFSTLFYANYRVSSMTK